MVTLLSTGIHNIKINQQGDSMFKKLNIKGVSHHLLLPILAVLVVAGIGGYIMQRSSSAASVCRNATYSINSRSECVRYAQYMLGVKPADAAFGPHTRDVLKAKTSQTSLNKTAWNKLCSKTYSTAVNKYRNAACIGGGYAKTVKNPSRRIAVEKFTYPAKPVIYPKRPGSAKWSKTVYVVTQAQKTQIQKATNSAKARYNKDVKAYNVAMAAAKARCKSNSSITATWNTTKRMCDFKTRTINGPSSYPSSSKKINVDWCRYMVYAGNRKGLLCWTSKDVIENSAEHRAMGNINEAAWAQCRQDNKNHQNYCVKIGEMSSAWRNPLK